MKKLLAAIASVILLQPFSTKLSAQVVDGKVPVAVSRAFSGKFPGGDLRKWEVRREGYIARFKKDGKKHYAYYSQEGHWKGTESPIRRMRHLPDSVKTAWESSGYAGWYVHNIKKIETPDQRLYVVHVNNSPTLDANKVDNFSVEHLLYYTSSGKLMRTMLL
jgi:alkyl sulfatase BDS1-like metallo-beta-lactamase superfamily hydrolase